MCTLMKCHQNDNINLVCPLGGLTAKRVSRQRELSSSGPLAAVPMFLATARVLLSKPRCTGNYDLRRAQGAFNLSLLIPSDYGPVWISAMADSAIFTNEEFL